MKIAFLIANAYAMGGTIRTVYTVAGGLAERGHEVEIVSLVQHTHTPFFTPPRGVSVHPLSSTRGWADRTQPGFLDRRRENRRSRHIPQTERPGLETYNELAVRALRAYLRRTDADVVVATRPGLNLLLARYAPKRLLRIGQEHVHLGNHKKDVKAAIARMYPRLDGMTVLTDSDRTAYQGLLAPPSGWATTMANPLPPADHGPATLDAPVIAAAGRLAPVKQYAKLLDAFAQVADRHPDWRLRIHGSGPAKAALTAKIGELGLTGRAHLPGRTKDLTGELAKASILAVSSRAEGFGLTITEAFSVGVPVVSFDCPHGPREIITNGHDGILVPHQDVEALAEGLHRLMEDAPLRHSMGANALTSALRYHPERILDQWEDFIAARQAAKSGRFPARSERRGALVASTAE